MRLCTYSMRTVLSRGLLLFLYCVYGHGKVFSEVIVRVSVMITGDTAVLNRLMFICCCNYSSEEDEMIVHHTHTRTAFSSCISSVMVDQMNFADHDSRVCFK